MRIQAERSDADASCDRRSLAVARDAGMIAAWLPVVLSAQRFGRNVRVLGGTGRQRPLGRLGLDDVGVR